jgi:hypothetical protein
MNNHQNQHKFVSTRDMRLSRRAMLRGGAAAGIAGMAYVTVGCGGSGDEDGPTATATEGSTQETPSAAGVVTPVLLTGEFVANQPARMAIGLLDDSNDFVRDAAIALKFFTVAEDGRTGTLRGEGTATYVELVLPADAADGSAQLGDAIGFYEAAPSFDVAGDWAVEIAATPPSATSASTVQAAFPVFDAYRIPAPGTVPPASQNDTVETNSNSSSLCSRDPMCSLHDKVIADYLGKGRPLVVQFSTPAFCDTRFCGPVLDVLLEQVPEYEDRIDFVHIEVWQDFQVRQYRAATQEWGLPTEPFTFFMAADGRVVSFLESVFTTEELTASLDGLLA